MMRNDITRDFNGAEEKGLIIYWNDNLGEFEVETSTEVISFYDKPNEDGDGSDGTAAAEVQKFIDEF
nr:MAG TPA: hypothetical protein [Bacteriophage sp.]